MALWLKKETDWDYVLRTSLQICVSKGLENYKTNNLHLKKDQILQYLDVEFTQLSFDG